MPRVYGNKVMLREYQKEDLPFMRSWVNNPNIVNNLSDIFLFPQTAEDTESFLETMLTHKNEMKGFIIAQKESGKYIGQIDLIHIDWKNRWAELGIVVGSEENLGRGYGSEAIALLQQFAFMDLGLNRLQLVVYGSNTRAIACYKKCGFVEEGRKRQHRYKQGNFDDEILMGILKCEWEGMKKPF